MPLLGPAWTAGPWPQERACQASTPPGTIQKAPGVQTCAVCSAPLSGPSILPRSVQNLPPPLGPTTTGWRICLPLVKAENNNKSNFS